MALFAVTRGQFSMIDIIQHCLTVMGPSHLTLWTWCIADYEIETFEWLLRSGDITSALLVIDQAGAEQVAKTRQFRAGTLDKTAMKTALMRRWVEKFGEGSIKVCLNHAKIATLDNGTLKVLVAGSMNLNANPRFENFNIMEGGAPFELVREIEAEMETLPPTYTRRQVEDVTGAHKLFAPADLIPFQSGGLKVWAK